LMTASPDPIPEGLSAVTNAAHSKRVV